MPQTSYVIQSVDATFDVIECFTQSRGKPLKYSEIQSLTGFSKNRTYRILATLCERGYLEKDPNTNEYRLGPSFLILGELYRRYRLGLRNSSVKILRELGEETKEYAVLTVRYGGDMQLSIEGVQGEHALQSRSHVGEAFPLHIGAAGKFLLAAIPEEERSEILGRMEFKRYTDRTIQSRERLEREIRVAMEQGYYMAEEDWAEGLNAVTAPVRDETGSIVACISVFIPTLRYTQEHIELSISAVLNAAHKLSKQLGFMEGIELS
jgi:DNA-binding IclR family transcriptional regulator